MTWRPLAGVIARAGATPDDVALTDADGTLTWRELLAAGRASAAATGALPDVGQGAWRDVLIRLIGAATNGGPLVVPDDSWPTVVRSLAAADVADVSTSSAAAEVLVWTSGSTGRPRPVRRTAASWDRSVDLISDLTGIGADDAVLLTGPPSSTLQLYAAWQALSVGATLIAPDADVAVRRAATALHGVPVVVAEAVADAVADPASWSSLRTVVVAGANIPTDLRQRVLARGWRWTAYYGAAELSFVAADVGAGLRPCPDVEVRLREPVSEARDGSRTGVLDVRSPYLALFDDEDPWRTAGDLVTVRPDGSLVVLGRGDAAVTTGGHTVVVEGVEAVVRTWPGVADAAVVGTAHPRLGEAVTAVVVGNLSRAELDGLAREHLPSASRPRRWWVAELLPRTSGGKLDRVAVQEACEATPVGAPHLSLRPPR